MNSGGDFGSQSGSDIDPFLIHDRAELAQALQVLKSRTSYTFETLGAEVGRPATTLHGWFTGRHLPYQRDNKSFETVLELLEVAEKRLWMLALARVRRSGSK